jgi:aminoglycoside N3'-acetyltransferase
MSVKQTIYHVLRRCTTQRQRERVKARVSKARRAVSPLLKRWYGTFESDELEAALRERMVNDFEILMVHSSISNLQPMYRGDARSLLDLLFRLAGPRTLAMPAFFFGTPELYNRDYYRKYPNFDVRRTPSQMGIVTELFRRSAGVTRSLHPTHSICAKGPLAQDLCKTHHLSTFTFGELSPFGIMGRRKTTIIGVGVEYYRSLTQVHSMEDVLGELFPIPRSDEGPVSLKMTDQAGSVLDYQIAPPISRNYVLKTERLNQFVSLGDIQEWRFKGTNLYVTQAAKIDDAIRRAASRGRSLYAWRHRTPLSQRGALDKRGRGLGQLSGSA